MSSRPIPGLPPPQPIPIRERSSILFVEKGRLDVPDGAFVLVDENGIRTHMPIGGLVCLMLEPATRVSHAAVVLAARAGTLLIWVGEAGVRLCAAGQPGGARADRLLLQARSRWTMTCVCVWCARCTPYGFRKTRRNGAPWISCVASRA